MDELLEKLREFKGEEESLAGDGVKIVDVSYYGKISVQDNKGERIEEDLYLVKKEVDGKTELEFHTNSGVLAKIGESGEIVISDEYKLLMSNTQLLQQTQKIMPVSLDKLEKINNRNQEQEKINTENVKNNEAVEQETDLAEAGQRKQYIPNAKDTKIAMNTKITETKTFAELVPEVKEKGIKDVIVRRIDGVNFEFIGINSNNEEIPLESLKQTEGTNPYQDIVKINQDGSEAKKDSALTILKIHTGENEGRENEGFTVKLGDYGIPEVSYYRRAKETNEYTSIPVNLQNTNQKRTELEVREFMEKKRNTNVNDNIERAKDRIEYNENEQTNLKNIDDDLTNDNIIDNSEILIREAARKCKVSVKAFKQELDKAKGDTLEEKIKYVEDEINDQAMMRRSRA